MRRHQEPLNATATPPGCLVTSGSVQLQNDETVTRTLVFADKNQTGTWQVSVPPGSMLVVGADDRYATAYPDSWYIEIADAHGRIICR